MNLNQYLYKNGICLKSLYRIEICHLESIRIFHFSKTCLDFILHISKLVKLLTGYESW